MPWLNVVVVASRESDYAIQHRRAQSSSTNSLAHNGRMARRARRSLSLSPSATNSLQSRAAYRRQRLGWTTTARPTRQHTIVGIQAWNQLNQHHPHHERRLTNKPQAKPGVGSPAVFELLARKWLAANSLTFALERGHWAYLLLLLLLLSFACCLPASSLACSFAAMHSFRYRMRTKSWFIRFAYRC